MSEIWQRQLKKYSKETRFYVAFCCQYVASTDLEPWGNSGSSWMTLCFQNTWHTFYFFYLLSYFASNCRGQSERIVQSRVLLLTAERYTNCRGQPERIVQSRVLLLTAEGYTNCRGQPERIVQSRLLLLTVQRYTKWGGCCFF